MLVFPTNQVLHFVNYLLVIILITGLETVMLFHVLFCIYAK